MIFFLNIKSWWNLSVCVFSGLVLFISDTFFVENCNCNAVIVRSKF
jgi:hypothetical protein